MYVEYLLLSRHSYGGFHPTTIRDRLDRWPSHWADVLHHDPMWGGSTKPIDKDLALYVLLPRGWLKVAGTRIDQQTPTPYELKDMRYQYNVRRGFDAPFIHLRDVLPTDVYQEALLAVQGLGDVSSVSEPQIHITDLPSALRATVERHLSRHA